MADDKKCVAALCVCGGWVMVAVLGHNAKSDRETWKEAGKMATEGFTIRSPLTVEECRALPVCKHHGDCTTNPENVRAEQERARVEQTDLLGVTP